MNQKLSDLETQLVSVLNEIDVSMNKLKKIVIDYADNNEPLDLYALNGGEVERKLDGLGFTNGWVIDRLLHVNPNSPRSKSRKIRKAQGYNG